MTDKEKDNVITELKKLTDNYFATLKDILVKNDLVYAEEQKTMALSLPFGGYIPKIDTDMLENLCLDLSNNTSCVQYSLYEKAYIEKKLAEYNEYLSPKSRILRHMSEIKRLKEKYHITDEDLKK